MRYNRVFVSIIIPVACLANWSFAQERTKPDSKPGHTHNQAYWDCAKACDDCARMCEACSAHCMQLAADGQKEHLETARACRDCASICVAASGVTARSGPFSDTICTACADACKRCGDACEKFKDNAIMKNCDAECRKCEASCREMLKHTLQVTERR
jgi:hypothetical protein